MEFKDRLKELREKNGITQKELGEKLGLNKNAVSTYEIGSREPNLEKIKKLAKIFNCSVDYLIGASDIESKAYSDYVIYYDKDEEKRLKVKDLLKIYKMIKEFPKE